MNFSILPSELKRVFSCVNSVVPRKAAMPVLENVLIEPVEGHPDCMRMTASDTETYVSVEFSVIDPVDIAPALLPVDRLSSYIKDGMGQWPVFIEIDLHDNGEDISFSDEMGEFNIFCNYTPSEFPQPQSVNLSSEFVVPTAKFIDSFSHASRFASADLQRPVMNCVYCGFYPDGLRIAASDGQRLFEDVVPEVVASEQVEVIVPRKIVTLASSLVSQSIGDNMSFAFSSKYVQFTQPGIIIRSTVKEGKYPKYKTIIPRTNNKRVTVNRDAFISAIKRVSIAADSHSDIVKLSFDGSSWLAISANDIESSTSAKASIHTDVQDNFSHPFDVGFRYSLLLDFITSCYTSQSFTMLFDVPERAALIVDEALPNRTMLVMPAKLV